MKSGIILALLLGLVPGVCRAQSSALPSTKLSTTVEGIHRVSADALAPLLGITTNQVRDRIAQGTLALQYRGQPIGWLPGTNNAELLFHAEALGNNYTTTNVYWLVDGTNQAPAAVNGAAPAAQTNGWYTNALNFEQDVYCHYELGTNPDSNYWFWTTALYSGHPSRGKFDYGFVLDALGPTNLMAQFSVRAYGANATNHSLALTINGTTNAAWTGAWSGIQPAQFTFAVPSALLRQGSNTLRFTALGPLLASQWYLDGAQLKYPRPYVATNGCLLCAANANAVVTLSGFANSNITVLDVTQPLVPLRVSNLTVQLVTNQWVTNQWSASFVPRQTDARYSVCQAGAANEVAALEAVWPVGLGSPTNRAALVIIAPPALMAAAQPLADYRNQQGLETKLVTLDSVYNEFNGGIREPEAIRSFLAYAWGQWRVRPTYALLIGNGTYDYRNLFGKNDNLVPTLMIPSLYGLVPSDSNFGQVTNVPGPQIAVGRLPVTNAAQLTNMITKIKAYEAAPSVGRAALLMADIPDVGNDFVASITNVQATLAGSFTNTVILPSDTATMRSRLLSNFNAGTELFCYLGHGTSDRFGSAGYLTTADVATLTNGNRLPLVSAMTCLSGFFAEPNYDCLSEALVLAAKPGAIAVLSASGFSLNDEATQLNLGLMEALVSGAPGRLGDFVRQAMTNYNQVTRSTPSGMYNILGDPALLYRGAPTPATVTGHLYYDVNGNGVQDPGEPGLTNVTVTLTSGTNVVRVTTDANGDWKATVLPGSVSVAVDKSDTDFLAQVPAGYRQTEGTDPTVVTAGALASTSAGNDGYYTPATVTGRLYYDVNGNGVQDPGEPGLTNVTVTVTSGANVVQVTSGANGNWTASVPPGSVSADVDNNDANFLAQVPAGYSQTEGTDPTVVTAVAGTTTSAGNDGYFKPGPTAVTMVWLGAYVDHGQVRVTWQTYSESGLLGFDVGRSAAGAEEQLVTVAPVLADGRSLGYRYTIPDNSARLPGQYTYRLVAYRDDGSATELARVKVSLAADASADVVRMEGIEATGDGVRVRWVGGQPPYVLESSPSAGPDAVWHVVGPAQAGETEALVPQEDQTGFFRVRFGQQ